MGAQQIFETLLANGVSLYLLAGNTIRAAPPEAVTDEARALIKANKTALVELLRQGEANDRATTPAGQHNPQVTAMDDDDFQERAGIIEFCGGVPKAWAEGLGRICVMPRPDDVDPRRWAAIVNAAASFADRWAVTAAKLGWTVQEVFGVHGDCPTKRFDASGLLMSMADPDKTLVELTQDTAIFEVGKARIRQTKHRSMVFSSEQRLMWE